MTRRNSESADARPVITVCRQAGGYVEVCGRLDAADEEERVLFVKAGLLKRFDAEHVVILGTSGLEETYDAAGHSDDEFGGDFLDSLREGDGKTILQFVFIAVVLFVAYMTGALEF